MATIEIINECAVVNDGLGVTLIGFAKQQHHRLSASFIHKHKWMGQEQFEELWKSGKQHTIDNPSQTEQWGILNQKKEQWVKMVAKPEINMRREIRKGETALKKFENRSSFVRICSSEK